MLATLGKAVQLRDPETPDSPADSFDIHAGERLSTRAAANGRTARPSHRQRHMIVALFCDLRGFTSFVDGAEPEDVLTLLDEYYDRLGPIIEKHRGTVFNYFGDGVMVLFDYAQPGPNAAIRASRVGLEMRTAVSALTRQWNRRGCPLGFGVGMALGVAVLTPLGCKGSVGYTAIGRVVNLASRLCSEALDGQVLVSGCLARAIDGLARLDPLGERTLKGFASPVTIFNLQTLGSPLRGRGPSAEWVARAPAVAGWNDRYRGRSADLTLAR